MKTPLTLLLALSAIAAAAPAQTSSLQQAILAEEREHDLARAEELYRQTFEAEGLPDRVRAQAGLRLGQLLQRLGKSQDAQDVLRRTAAIEDPAGAEAKEILEQDPEGKARQEALRAKARELLEDLSIWRGRVDELDPDPRADLLWMGAAATPELIVAARRLVDGQNAYRVFRAGTLLQMAFSAGGDGALETIRTAPDSDDVEWRTAVAMGLSDSMADAAMFEAAEQFLEDPEADVVTAALRGVHPRWPAAALVSVVDHPEAQVRGQPILCLTRDWENVNHPDGRPEATVELLIPKVKAMLRSVEPGIGRDGVQLLVSNAMLTTSESRSLLLASIPDIEVERGSAGILRGFSGLPALAAPDEHLDRLLELGRQLGPLDGSILPRDRAPQVFDRVDWQLFVNMWIELSVPKWEREAVAARLFELMKLGYGVSGSAFWVVQPTWGDGDALEVASLLAVADSAGTDWIGDWLELRDLPREAWPLIRVGLDRHPHVKSLASAAARTGHPEAVEWIEAMATRPDVEPAVYADDLVLATKREDSEEARAALRRVALKVGRGYSRLIELGDRAFMDDLVALASGYSERKENDILLYLLSPTSGYSPADGASLVRRVASFGAGGSAVAYARGAWQQATGEVPIEVMDALVDVALESRAATRYPPPNEQARSWDLWQWAVERAPSRYLQRLARSDDSAIAEYALSQSYLDPDFPVAEIESALARLPQDSQLRLGDLALKTDDSKKAAAIVEICLASENSKVRWRTYNPELFVRGILTEEHILAGLRDDHASVKVQSIACLTADLGKASNAIVAELLGLAESDENAGVRTKAREFLDTLRTFREQKAHWQRVFSGVDTTPASAAAALLRQAKEGNKDVQVLAIRSLGSLGAPEALPFLIDWTQSEDPEIAAAAKDAIRVIHSKDGD